MEARQWAKPSPWKILMLSEELEKLATLHQEGALSDEEFEAAKAQLLKGQAIQPTNNDRPRQSDPLMGLNLDNYRALMHGSQLAHFILPGLGLVGPIILWIIAKDAYPEVDIEGKQIINWVISEIIYTVVAVGLSCLMIGLPLLLAIIIAAAILPLIGAIQASKGKSYSYPLTIEFIK
jgi:uncharacterized protein